MIGPGDDDGDINFETPHDDEPLDEGWQDQFDDDPNPYHGTYSED